MHTYIWVDSWQQQCCGDDFRVGSTVEWTVRRRAQDDRWVAELLGAEWDRKVEYREEHHSTDEEDLECVTLSGTVRSIKTVMCDRELGFVPGPGPQGPVLVPVPHSGRLTEVEVADPWLPEPADRSSTFDGWIVELELGAMVNPLDTTEGSS